MLPCSRWSQRPGQAWGRQAHCCSVAGLPRSPCEPSVWDGRCRSLAGNFCLPQTHPWGGINACWRGGAKLVLTSPQCQLVLDMRLKATAVCQSRGRACSPRGSQLFSCYWLLVSILDQSLRSFISYPRKQTRGLRARLVDCSLVKVSETLDLHVSTGQKQRRLQREIEPGTQRRGRSRF